MAYHHYRHLNSSDREHIFAGLERGESLRSIAEDLNRPPSTISREVRRNSDSRGYGLFFADCSAYARSNIPRRKRRVHENPWLWRYIVRHLRKKWSPEQIAASLKETYPHDVRKHISHETIYAALYVLPRGTLKKELLSCLRQRRRKRYSRRNAHARRGNILGAVPIQERPKIVERRRVPGHWEGDLLVGRKHQSAIGTLVERKTRYLILCKLGGLTAEDAHRGFARKLHHVPRDLRKTLTVDRGSEMSKHRDIARDVKLSVYFCDPHSPWQRGTNENTNGLLRQYLPKATDLSLISQRELNRIAREINTRPRKTLQWKTPLQAFTSSRSVALRS